MCIQIMRSTGSADHHYSYNKEPNNVVVDSWTHQIGASARVARLYTTYTCAFVFVSKLTASDDLIGTYCGSNEFDLTTAGRYMRIEFKTDSSVADFGFQIHYQAFNGKLHQR